MPTTDPADAVYEEFLDRLLRGEAADVSSFLARHPATSPEERRRLEALADAVRGGHDPGGHTHLTPEPGLPLERIGEFRLIRRLGEGGMGMVFLAEQQSLGRLVALKIIRPERSGSPAAAADLLREAQAIAKLRHPHIVTVFATGEESGIHYLAMELVPGRGLDDVLREAAASGGRPPMRRILRWMADVAWALQCAHDAGIIHRDVKPSNVRITPEGRALLVDFGLARHVVSTAAPLTGEFRGTPHYASPEQVAARQIGITPQTDVYSLGVMLYESTTGRVPFDGKTKEEVFNQILVKEPVPPARINPSMPHDLEIVIQKAMEKDRERRYATAKALAADLEAVAELRPVQAKPASVLVKAAKWIRRNRALAAGIAVAVFGVAAAAGTLLLTHAGASRAVRRMVGDARRALAADDSEAAMQPLRRAAAMRPDDASVLRLLRDAEARQAERDGARAREQDRLAAQEALGQGRRGLERYRAGAARKQDLTAEQAALRRALSERALRAGEVDRLQRLDRDVQAVQLELEETFLAVLDRAHRAERLDPSFDGIQHLRADLYVEKHREALARRDRGAARFWASLVEKHDAEGRHRDEIAGIGRVTVETSPPRAALHLFRMVEQADVVEGGDRRLVPVPVGDPVGFLIPGARALRVIRGSGAVKAGDVIWRIEGHPIEDALFVAGGNDAVQPLDRLVSIDDRCAPSSTWRARRRPAPRRPARRLVATSSTAAARASPSPARASPRWA
jgi:hypothetical protein